MNIVLIGMMGSGKSSVGKRLAKILDWRHIDLDHQIEREQNCTISQIVTYAGWDFFRNLEAKALTTCLHQDRLVVSTGGGIVEKEDNWPAMWTIGKIVYLKASLESIYDRVKNSDHRPLLKSPDVLDTLNQLLAKRQAKYELADLTIDTNSSSIHETLGQIMNFFQLTPARGRKKIRYRQ